STDGAGCGDAISTSRASSMKGAAHSPPIRRTAVTDNRWGEASTDGEDSPGRVPVSLTIACLAPPAGAAVFDVSTPLDRGELEGSTGRGTASDSPGPPAYRHDRRPWLSVLPCPRVRLLLDARGRRAAGRPRPGHPCAADPQTRLRRGARVAVPPGPAERC